MDLLQSVRKEGSRGGRGDFTWDEVKNSTHRESYLGHSLMAPVGRWQKNRDLSWYAKTGANEEEMSEADARKDEIRRIKEAEEQALAKALGFEVPPKKSENANMIALEPKAAKRVVDEELAAEDSEGNGAKGLGFGEYDGTAHGGGGDNEVLAGIRVDRDVMKQKKDGSKKERRERRRRSRSRDWEGDRDKDRRRRRRHEHRSRSRTRSPRERRRSRSPERRRLDDDNYEGRNRREYLREEQRSSDYNYGRRGVRTDAMPRRKERSREREYHSDRRWRNRTDHF